MAIITLPLGTKIRDTTLEILSEWTFKTLDGKVIKWSEGQLEIIDCILHRSSIDDKNRVQIICSTQYGKSYAVAAGVLIRVCHKSEPWGIVAPSKDKARIIMDYVINFALQNPVAKKLLQAEGAKTIEKLSQRTNKDRVTFFWQDLDSNNRVISTIRSEIRTFSAEAHRKGAVSKSLMGYGSPNIIEDESALIPDDIHATVVRMLGGHAKNFMIKIGNPFTRGHFLKSWEGSRFYKIFIDYTRALKEGRYTQAFIDEMREQPLFEILYGCLFPMEGLIDKKGWLPLISEATLQRALVPKLTMLGTKKLGADIAGGGRNYSANVIRGMNVAELVRRSNEKDTMITASNILTDAKDYDVESRNISLDYIGIGRGVGDRLRQIDKNIKCVVSGNIAEDSSRFVNVRAELFWRMKDWLENGGKLKDSPHWAELLKIKYKVVSGKKIRIMSKEEMLAENIESPDIADSFSLTFYTKDSYDQGDTLSSHVQPNNGIIRVSKSNYDPYE